MLDVRDVPAVRCLWSKGPVRRSLLPSIGVCFPNVLPGLGRGNPRKCVFSAQFVASIFVQPSGHCPRGGSSITLDSDRFHFLRSIKELTQTPVLPFRFSRLLVVSECVVPSLLCFEACFILKEKPPFCTPSPINSKVSLACKTRFVANHSNRSICFWYYANSALCVNSQTILRVSLLQIHSKFR